MAWKIDFDPGALGDLKKIDRQHQRRIMRFLRKRVLPLDNPRSIGAPLKGPLGELWKYRVGDYRIICDIQDPILKILVLGIGHRREVYRRDRYPGS